MVLTAQEISTFQKKVTSQGAALYRDLPWRRTRDPYLIMVSECMLQQTQVKRVLGYWDTWLALFPTAEALAQAPLEQVLQTWRGLGYNRRAIALRTAAQQVSQQHSGVMPSSKQELLALPGVGPTTAAGIRVFAYNTPDTYLETNVRTVFLHELFPNQVAVPDRLVSELVGETCPQQNPRAWYYALLDYGAHLKSVFPNPSRRSAQHTRQSTFEGSHRQKRAWLLRAIQDAPGSDATRLSAGLSQAEAAAKRPAVPLPQVEELLAELEAEGFIARDKTGLWWVAE